jgi:hypothetical protein
VEAGGGVGGDLGEEIGECVGAGEENTLRSEHRKPVETVERMKTRYEAITERQ